MFKTQQTKFVLFLGLYSIIFSANAGTIIVSSASSLTNAFSEISQKFQQKRPNIKVKLNFAGSGILLQQLDHGAPVDILAVADQKTMDLATKKQLIDTATRHTFAYNSLVLITPRNSPYHITKLQDLLNQNIKRIALSNPNGVPVGRYSRTALEKSKLYNTLQSKMIVTQNVRQSLNYVIREEVDAGFVYRTDANLFPNKTNIQMTIPLQIPVSYPIAITASSQNKTDAKYFEDFVLSKEGQEILHKYGFNYH